MLLPPKLCFSDPTPNSQLKNDIPLMLSTSLRFNANCHLKKKSNLPSKEEDLWLLRLQQECATISTRFYMKSSPNAVFPLLSEDIRRCRRAQNCTTYWPVWFSECKPFAIFASRFFERRCVTAIIKAPFCIHPWSYSLPQGSHLLMLAWTCPTKFSYLYNMTVNKGIKLFIFLYISYVALSLR